MSTSIIMTLLGGNLHSLFTIIIISLPVKHVLRYRPMFTQCVFHKPIL